MILLGFLLWLVVGAFSAGMVFELHYERVEPASAIVLTIFAPVTLIYVIWAFALRAGEAVVSSIKKQ